MVSPISTSKIAPASTDSGDYVSRLASLSLLSQKEHDALVSEIATLLDSNLRSEVFKSLTISTLSQFHVPSPREYDDFFVFRRAYSESLRLFEKLGLFEVLGDGKIIDRNDFHSPLTKDGAYYSKLPDGPSVLGA